MMNNDNQRTGLASRVNIILVGFLVFLLLLACGIFVLVEDPLQDRNRTIVELTQKVATLQGELDSLNKAGESARTNFDAMDKKAAACDQALAQTKRDLTSALAEVDRQKERVEVNIKACSERIERIRKAQGG